MQGKWRIVHTASCRCYRLIDREYSFIFCIVYFLFVLSYLTYLQGKWRRGRVHTASCCCYRLIDREYHNLMVRFPLLSPNRQHCSRQENFVIALSYFLYSVFVFGIWYLVRFLSSPPTTNSFSQHCNLQGYFIFAFALSTLCIHLISCTHCTHFCPHDHCMHCHLIVRTDLYAKLQSIFILYSSSCILSRGRVGLSRKV